MIMSKSRIKLLLSQVIVLEGYCYQGLKRFSACSSNYKDFGCLLVMEEDRSDVATADRAEVNYRRRSGNDNTTKQPSSSTTISRMTNIMNASQQKSLNSPQPQPTSLHA
jgi:hypothetical protein